MKLEAELERLLQLVNCISNIEIFDFARNAPDLRLLTN
jgi:hypothetical protein